jgi:hypothetical protein
MTDLINKINTRKIDGGQFSFCLLNKKDVTKPPVA